MHVRPPLHHPVAVHMKLLGHIPMHCLVFLLGQSSYAALHYPGHVYPEYLSASPDCPLGSGGMDVRMEFNAKDVSVYVACLM